MEYNAKIRYSIRGKSINFELIFKYEESKILEMNFGLFHVYLPMYAENVMFLKHQVLKKFYSFPGHYHSFNQLFNFALIPRRRKLNLNDNRFDSQSSLLDISL